MVDGARVEAAMAPAVAPALESAMRRALELAARGPLTGGNPRVGCVPPRRGRERHRRGLAPRRRHPARGGRRARPGAGRHRAHRGRDPRALQPHGAHRSVLGTAHRRRCRAGRVCRRRPGAGLGRRGRAACARQGVEVVAGVLEDEATAFIEPWLVAQRRRRPWVTVKWAATLDGRAAAADGSSQWITGPEARGDGHRLRAESDAILTGTGTVLADDPAFTARDADGAPLPHQRCRSSSACARFPADARLRGHPSGLIEAGDRPLAEVLDEAFARGFARVLVEAGPGVTSAIIRDGLADELSDLPRAEGCSADRRPPSGTSASRASGTLANSTSGRVRRLGDDLAIHAFSGVGRGTATYCTRRPRYS